MQCSYCGREVQETRHTQRGYRADYYLLHTGQTEWAVLKSPKEDMPSLRYLRLTNPIDIVSCADCYDRPQIRQSWEESFNSSGSNLGKGHLEGLERSRLAAHDHG